MMKALNEKINNLYQSQNKKTRAKKQVVTLDP